MSDNKEIGPKFINPTKKYGLIKPNKSGEVNAAPKKPMARPCIFDEDDELEQEDSKQASKTRVNTNESRMKKQTQINIEKALQEDPNIFEYDAIYEKVEEAKEKNDPKAKNKSTEPKYVAGIMKAAAERQMEFEKRQDRKIQRERETEGDEFGDKEAFVTASYRKRMEERQKIEEEEKRQEQIEALFDVRKQKDLSGFYMSMLKLKSGEMVIEEESEKLKRLEREKIELEEKMKKEQEFAKKSVDTKKFRVRKDADEESSEDEQKPAEETVKRHDEEKTMEAPDEPAKEIEEPLAKKQKIEDDEKEMEKVVPNEEVKEEKVEPKKIETKAERWARLFNKRTVGKVLDSEIADYYHRKDNILTLKLYIERE